MATTATHNKKNSAVKRIMQEARELAEDLSTDYSAAPLEDDIFEWHGTIRGASDTEFEGGLYHIRISLPPSYPFAAPDMMILTPNGRFEVGKKICIDGLTSFHAGSWQPAWGVRTAIVGLISFWGNKGEALRSVGALDYPVEERRRLAKLSRKWRCPKCEESNEDLLPDSSTLASLPADGSPSSSNQNSTVSTDQSIPCPSPLLVQSVESSAVVQAPIVSSPKETIDPISPPSPSTTLQDVDAPGQPIETDVLSTENTPMASITTPATVVEIVPSRNSDNPVTPPLWFDSIFLAIILALIVVLARRML
ncbi:Non-canonical ubiquitin conjugating enzyme 1 [Phaffia rhodozyma]|uniref:Non-canonical ubiquitin conjugating enzyme 1 n=1 Tax=Phaffia rhodozyma TaxID=264483 RepID=A0A0F7SHR1_PHARH|nr:Non-canonical ubiquitin conjugating enzyme 1 [Phaffia rhodozyma]